MLFTFLLVLFVIECNVCEPLLPSIASKLKKVVFVYPSGAQSERDLFLCPDNAACNVIHKRFWLPPLVERLCRCPRRRECTWTWSESIDNYTTMLDSRSQLKFCSELVDLPPCTLKKNAMRVTVKESNNATKAEISSVKTKSGQKSMRSAEPKNVTALCQCKEPHYWKQRFNTTKSRNSTTNSDSGQQFYVCSKLKKCSSNEFCGFIRTDTHSTYYRCSCPKGHMCITKDKTIFKVEEMLFKGDGYKAFCFPVDI